jgi:sugar lactone lactonase YvrE
MTLFGSSQSKGHAPIRGFIRRLLATLSVLFGVVLAYLFFWPVPIDPIANAPFPPNPAGQGVFTANQKLDAAELLTLGPEPEGIAFDDAGNLYTGLVDGRILRADQNGTIATFANTQGRPLGMNFDADGNLIVADAKKGLLSIDASGVVTILTDSVDGEKMIFVDDLAIARDGMIYFSDASQRHAYGHDLLEIYEGRPTGRLVSYNPTTGETRILLDNLYFANGVALSRDEDFILVNETFRARITRYWLSGEKAGTHEVFIDRLPGFPDNITEAPDGGFWLALPGPRTDQIDALIASPFVRKIAWRIFNLGISPVEQHSWAVKLTADGVPVASLEDASGRIYMVTSVIEKAGKLYLGSLATEYIGIIDAP